MPVTIKKYKCPLCGTEIKTGTNHCGIIYDRCKKCGMSCLYPVRYTRDFIKTIKTAQLNFYCFDLSKSEEEKNYSDLFKALENYNYHCFRVFENPSFSIYFRDEIKKFDKKEISIFEDLDEQYFTEIGRLHNWLEFEFPNKKIKCGYYLKDFKENA